MRPEVDVRQVLKVIARATTAPIPPGLHHRLVVAALLLRRQGASALPVLSAGTMAEAGAALPRRLPSAMDPQAALTAREASAPRSASLREHLAGQGDPLLMSVVARVLSSLRAASTTAATPPPAATHTELRKAPRTTPTTLVPCPAARRAPRALNTMAAKAGNSVLAALHLSPEAILVTTLAHAPPPMLPPPPLNPSAPRPS